MSPPFQKKRKLEIVVDYVYEILAQHGRCDFAHRLGHALALPVFKLGVFFRVVFHEIRQHVFAEHPEQRAEHFVGNAALHFAENVAQPVFGHVSQYFHAH